MDMNDSDDTEDNNVIDKISQIKNYLSQYKYVSPKEKRGSYTPIKSAESLENNVRNFNNSEEKKTEAGKVLNMSLSPNKVTGGCPEVKENTSSETSHLNNNGKKRNETNGDDDGSKLFGDHLDGSSETQLSQSERFEDDNFQREREESNSPFQDSKNHVTSQETSTESTDSLSNEIEMSVPLSNSSSHNCNKNELKNHVNISPNSQGKIANIEDIPSTSQKKKIKRNTAVDEKEKPKSPKKKRLKLDSKSKIQVDGQVKNSSGTKSNKIMLIQAKITQFFNKAAAQVMIGEHISKEDEMLNTSMEKPSTSQGGRINNIDEIFPTPEQTENENNYLKTSLTSQRKRTNLEETHNDIILEHGFQGVKASETGDSQVVAKESCLLSEESGKQRQERNAEFSRCADLSLRSQEGPASSSSASSLKHDKDDTDMGIPFTSLEKRNHVERISSIAEDTPRGGDGSPETCNHDMDTSATYTIVKQVNDKSESVSKAEKNDLNNQVETTLPPQIKGTDNIVGSCSRERKSSTPKKKTQVGNPSNKKKEQNIPKNRQQKVKVNTNNNNQVESTPSHNPGTDNIVGTNPRKRKPSTPKKKTRESNPSPKKGDQNIPENRKLKPEVKVNTVTGDEYQRIIQVLVRHRGYEIPGFQLGVEVRDVKDLDDIVCLYNDKCRLIQVKHKLDYEENIPSEDEYTEIQNSESGKKQLNVLNNLFKTNCSLTQTNTFFELVLYFMSFCTFKTSVRFASSDLEEITFVTNIELVPGEKLNDNKIANKFIDFLILRSDFQSDRFLYLDQKSGKKYSLNIDTLKKNNEFINYLQSIFQRPEWGLEPDSELADSFITEYLEKVRVIVEYPDVEEIEDKVFKEIFTDPIFKNIFHKNDVQLLENTLFGRTLVHSEIRNLILRKKKSFRKKKSLSFEEFLSNDHWKEKLNEVKHFIEKCMLTGITNYETQKLLNRFRCISFDQESINDMYDDMDRFLSQHEQFVLYCYEVQNETLAAIKILNILQRKNKNNNAPVNVVAYTTLHELINHQYLLEQFLKKIINTLIITVVKEVVGVEKQWASLAKKLVEAGSRCQNQKVILISGSENIFTAKIKALSEDKFLEKKYQHDFNCLEQTSQEAILNKKVLFQGKPISFGSLFQGDLTFAYNIMDDNVMIKLSDSEEKMICLLDEAAFSSPGFNEDYYISRNIFQENLNFESIKERMKDELFFITGIQPLSIDKILKINGIGAKFIHFWPKKLNHGKRKIKKNGIVLRGLTDESDNDIFNEITQNNILVHWILICEKNLVLVKSNSKHADYKALSTNPPTLIEEKQFLSSEPLKKTIILVGESGVGKSTVLTYVANELLKLCTNKPMWIVKINLRKFCNSNKDFFDENDKRGPIDLISKMGSQSDSSNIITQRIIKEGLKVCHHDKFDLVLLLDGFNEIGSSCQTGIYNLIETLNSECNVRQIWVTTQPQERAEMEIKFKVQAYFLDNLDGEKQVNLMVKYWASKYKSYNPPIMHDENELKDDARIALQTWKESINDQEDQSFTQVSLNVIILSDILLKTNHRLKKGIDLCELYEAFIDKKFFLYEEEVSVHCLMDVEIVKNKMFQDLIKEILQELSVNNILSSYPRKREKGTYSDQTLLKKLDALTRFKDFVEGIKQVDINYRTILSKIGLLTVKEDLDFIHESFVQYFFSEYLVKNLDNIVLKYFLLTVFLSEKALYLGRKFLNHLIRRQFEEVNKSKDNIFMPRTVKKIDDRRLKVDTKDFTQVVEEKFDHIIILLLHLMGCRRYTFLQKWVETELQICTELDNAKAQIAICLDNEEKALVPRKIRCVLKIDKSNCTNDIKLRLMLDKNINEEERSSSTFI